MQATYTLEGNSQYSVWIGFTHLFTRISVQTYTCIDMRNLKCTVLTKCYSDAGTPSTMLAQHQINIE